MDQVYELFDRFVPSGAQGDLDSPNASLDETSASDSPRNRTVFSRDLPHLLSEYETQQGKPLIEDDSRPQLEQFCQQFPDHAISCNDLINMIRGLEQARLAALAASDGEASGDDSLNSIAGRGGPASRLSNHSRASSSGDSSEVHDGMREPETSSYPPTSSTPPRDRKTSSSPTRPDYLRSQSMQADLTLPGPAPRLPTSHRVALVSASASPTRTRTTSASAAPTSEREKGQSFLHTNQNRSLSQQSDTGRTSSKDVLRGKGNAPPSSWQRPRPQALASTGKIRRTSDASAASSLDREHDNSGRPQSARSVSSQPWSDSGGSPGIGSHRKSPSAYVFPRATSPGDETWYAEQEEKYEYMSDRERTRSTSSRAASPDQREKLGFQSFASLSSSRGPSGGVITSPRRSDVRSFSQTVQSNFDDDSGSDTLADLQRRYEHLARLLQEKERSFEDSQSYHESSIAELESRVETLQGRIHSLSKTSDEMKQREQRYLDEISRLESDLATSQKRCETLERLRDMAQQETSAREASIVVLQGKVNDLQERITAMDREEAAHLDNEREWETDRDRYRKEIEKLRSDLRGALDKEAQIETLVIEKDALEAQLRALQNDLEEARSRSGFLINGRGSESLPGTVSKRLGRELAGALENIMDEPAEGAVDAEPNHAVEDGEASDPDESLESVIVTTTRRRRVHQRTERVLTEIATQTEAAEPDSTPRPADEPSPPTYDEAALEESVLARMHPACHKTMIPETTSELPPRTTLGSVFNMNRFPERERARTPYEDLTRRVGLRCVVLEKALDEQGDSQGQAGGVSSSAPSPPSVSRSERNDVVSQLLGIGASRVRGCLPESLQAKLSSMAAPDTFSRLLVWSLCVLAGGLILGNLLSPRQQHIHYHGTAGGVHEEGTSWTLMNTFAGHGPEYFEPGGAVMGVVERYLRSAPGDRPELVPI
ncbi:hypothetical protein BCV69DRAFT_281609 [Microstroma glucosiphilum]|uniref:Uncharacterized protein n=1 Tax=Pseudomicrostroma glucosiphilum TaxID=1684307 RepID=A0A316UA30_9BASI|nr:hypothetical protein BCV69DRAFT_281609 [Pseudomicrostroma glucosiphilum]PWN21674.1 hypothetical protein BCV69DRAFT_281609 [Pseudomicrostroma glucosiphilum]